MFNNNNTPFILLSKEDDAFNGYDDAETMVFTLNNSNWEKIGSLVYNDRYSTILFDNSDDLYYVYYKGIKKYNIIHGIFEVIGPDEKDWTLNAWMLFIVTETENRNPFWLLIKREKDLSGTLVAIGPKAFADYNKSNQDEAKRDLKRLINYLVTYLNKFYCSIFIPSY